LFIDSTVYLYRVVPHLFSPYRDPSIIIILGV